jgi:hypothetical protein
MGEVERYSTLLQEKEALNERLVCRRRGAPQAAFLLPAGSPPNALPCVA